MRRDAAPRRLDVYSSPWSLSNNFQRATFIPKFKKDETIIVYKDYKVTIFTYTYS